MMAAHHNGKPQGFFWNDEVKIISVGVDYV